MYPTVLLFKTYLVSFEKYRLLGFNNLIYVETSKDDAKQDTIFYN